MSTSSRCCRLRPIPLTTWHTLPPACWSWSTRPGICSRSRGTWTTMAPRSPGTRSGALGCGPNWTPTTPASMASPTSNSGYILDPHDLTDHELEDIRDPIEDPPDAPRTKDFPGETFRLLKEHEIKEYREYRTKRLVLEAW